MRTVGRLKGTVWERLDGLQHNLNAILRGRFARRRGVRAFRTEEEFHQWQKDNPSVLPAPRS